MESNKYPLVSVIVATYNSAKYVLETLESIQNQTYSNLELIITDDGSKDDTIAMCRAWLQAHQERFVRTQLVTVEKNTGIPANCNRGLEAARGEWVKYIAADDTLLPDCISANVEICLRSNSDILQTNVNYYEDAFDAAHYTGTSKLHDDIFFKTTNPKKQYHIIIYKNKVAAPAVFIKKSVLTALHGFDASIPLFEDWPFWIKATKNGFGIQASDIVTVNYRTYSSRPPIMSNAQAENLLRFAQKYKYKNVYFLHYFLYVSGLRIILLLHRLGIFHKSDRLDFFIATAISKMMYFHQVKDLPKNSSF
jgi:glycosyltransferase involved in cell wall biosynthesis